MASLGIKHDYPPSHIIALHLYIHPDMSHHLLKPLAHFKERFARMENKNTLSV